jgi:hypothetical protein
MVSAVTNDRPLAISSGPSSIPSPTAALQPLLRLHQQPIEALAEPHRQTKVERAEISEKCSVLKIGVCTYTGATRGSRIRGPPASEMKHVCMNATISKADKLDANRLFKCL